MPRVAILGFDAVHASVLGGVADMLQVANAHMLRQGIPASEFFEWDFLSAQQHRVRASNGLELGTRPLAEQRGRYDLVFIPSLHYQGWRSFQRFLSAQHSVQAWLIEQWEQGAWLCANCTATFLLAETGLLDNRMATTTWWLEHHFRQRFPLVDLQMRPMITESERLVCGGAHASFLMQTVHVLKQFAGQAIAMQCAHSMLIDLTQTTQTPLQPLVADRSHNDPLVQRAQRWLQERLAEPVRMTELAQYLAVSERTLIRRFNAVLQQPPLTYLQNLRIDTARSLLEAGDLSIEQIALHAGYSDISSFSRLFRKRIGFTPAAYRARFR